MSKDFPTKTVRFGILCDSLILKQWQLDCIEKILSLGYTSLDLIVLNDGAENDDTSKTERTYELLKKGASQFLFQVYSKVLSRPKTRRKVDVEGTFPDAAVIRCKYKKKGKFSQYFSKEDVNKIKGYNLDFLLRFGFNIIRGGILKSARFGVWSFHHDDESKYRGSPACFWEIFNDDPESGAILQRLTNRLDGGIVLRKGIAKTVPTSYAANMDSVYSAALVWPAQVCIDIHSGRTGYVDGEPSKTSAPIYKPPGNMQMLSYFFKLTYYRIRAVFNKAFYEDAWNVGVVDAPIQRFIEDTEKPNVKFLPAPEKERFIADPFGVMMDGTPYVFYEDFDYGKAKGIISWASLDADAGVLESGVSMDFPCHLSYPYLFEHEGVVYCIPETAQANEVALYRAVDFPLKWEKVGILIKDFPAVDATVFQHEGKWWLTCSRSKEFHNLYVWHADKLEGPWTPHAANPVKTDIKSARPAGTPFYHNGALFRPAQSCAKAYGEAVVINKVIELSEERLIEDAVATISPYKGSEYTEGIHTLSSMGSKTLIDGNRTVFSLGKTGYCFKALWRKVFGKREST